jgi:hypothetical protein
MTKTGRNSQNRFEARGGVTLLLAVCFALLVMDLLAGYIYNAIMQTKAEKALSTSLERDIYVPNTCYHHDLIPHAAIPEAKWGPDSYSVFTNSLGFRDREVREVDRVSQNCRIVFIGDSFTFGVGIDYQKTFVGIVDTELRKRGVEVLNAGVSGYCPSIEVRKVDHVIRQVGLQFQELVVFLDISDPEDETYYFDVDDFDHVISKSSDWGRAIKEDNSRSGIAFQVFRFLRDHTVLFRHFWWSVRGTLAPPLINLRRSLWTVDPRLIESYGREGLEKMKKAMDRLVKLLEAKGILLTIVVYPWPDQIWHQDKDSIQIRFWHKWADDNNVTFINLFPAFFSGDPPEQAIKKYYIPGDMHWTEAGHSLVARTFLSSYRSITGHDTCDQGQAKTKREESWVVSPVDRSRGQE